MLSQKELGFPKHRNILYLFDVSGNRCINLIFNIELTKGLLLHNSSKLFSCKFFNNLHEERAGMCTDFSLRSMQKRIFWQPLTVISKIAATGYLGRIKGLRSCKKDLT